MCICEVTEGICNSNTCRKDLSVMKHYMYPLKDTKVFLLFRIRTRKTLELTQY